MSAALSVWLDLCRVLAAAVVFVGHSRGLAVAPDWIAPHWHRSADDAVIAFFVISGYVIAWSVDRPGVTVRGYAEARASRIYSVAIPAVLVALALDHIGMRLDPTLYAVDWQYPRPWLFIPIHWLFLGGTWLGPMDPFSMASYWSLPYEVWYYVLFGCATLLHGRARAVGIAAALAIMGPRIWLLLPCWWLGVLLYRHGARLALARPVALAVMALAVAAYGVYAASGLRAEADLASRAMYGTLNHWLPVPLKPGGTVHPLSDYVVALLFAAFLVGCASSRIAFGPRTAAAIRWLAGYTFSLYLVHFSLLVLFAAAGWTHVDGGRYALVIASTLVAAWLLGQIGEVRRDLYRRAIAWLLDRLVGPHPPRVPASGKE
ncbi:acyltransferase family protein [Piscinibacter sp.]|uniref:acyltransferase family protein n=1 Tax=Piscinibacter sp. TaxID=1903157 RepID=UPI0039E2F419